MALNLHLVRLFTTVATYHSFSRAAEALYISQPAVSKGVATLERQLGVSLFDRSQPQVALTEAGELLWRHAQALFASERAAEAALAQLRNLEQGHLAIGASTTIGIYLLPAVLARFHQQYPAIHLSVDIGNTHELVRHLVETPLDAIFVESPLNEEDLQVTAWQNDTLVMIAPPRHPLTFQSHLTIADVAQHLILVREAGSGTREVIDAHILRKGVTLPHVMEVGHTEAIKRLVAEGLGLGIVSDFTCQEEVNADRVVILDVPELTVRRHLFYATVTDRPISPAHQAFRDTLERIA